jgi:hypothetical protein
VPLLVCALQLSVIITSEKHDPHSDPQKIAHFSWPVFNANLLWRNQKCWNLLKETALGHRLESLKCERFFGGTRETGARILNETKTILPFQRVRTPCKKPVKRAIRPTESGTVLKSLKDCHNNLSQVRVSGMINSVLSTVPRVCPSQMSFVSIQFHCSRLTFL